jgi:hypothetical protein
MPRALCQVICPAGSRTLQAEPHWNPATLHPHRAGEEATSGHPRGHMRPTRSTTHLRRGHVLTRFLLAYCRGRRYRSSTLLRRVLVLCSTNSPTRPSALDDPHHMAFCGLGSGPCWATPEGARGLHPLTYRHQQVLKVDRGLANHANQVRAGGTLLY